MKRNSTNNLPGPSFVFWILFVIIMVVFFSYLRNTQSAEYCKGFHYGFLIATITCFILSLTNGKNPPPPNQ